MLDRQRRRGKTKVKTSSGNNEIGGGGASNTAADFTDRDYSLWRTYSGARLS